MADIAPEIIVGFGIIVIAWLFVRAINSVRYGCGVFVTRLVLIFPLILMVALVIISPNLLRGLLQRILGTESSIPQIVYELTDRVYLTLFSCGLMAVACIVGSLLTVARPLPSRSSSSPTYNPGTQFSLRQDLQPYELQEIEKRKDKWRQIFLSLRGRTLNIQTSNGWWWGPDKLHKIDLDHVYLGSQPIALENISDYQIVRK